MHIAVFSGRSHLFIVDICGDVGMPADLSKQPFDPPPRNWVGERVARDDRMWYGRRND